MALKRKNRTLVDIIFANRKNTLIFAGLIIGFSFYLVESAHTFTWDQMVWAYAILSVILVVSGKKELEETHGILTDEEMSELLFGEGGLLEKKQKMNLMPEGTIKPTGVIASETIEGNIKDCAYGYDLLDKDGLPEEWVVTLDPKTQSITDNAPAPAGFTGANKKRYRLHPESYLERKKYIEKMGKTD